MLKLKRILLQDFGTYKGTQSVEFPDSGVTIVYGENMRGKTTLLNAIRFAFWGKVISRHERELQLSDIGNWENTENGKYGFKVVLEFDALGVGYELTRLCRLQKGVTIPQSDADYAMEHFLKKNGSILGPDACSTELFRILPEKVSRFFLFDGELLQQYEELLRNDSEMGRQIKGAVEQILGVPILQNARAHTYRAYEEAQDNEARAAQKNQKTKELGNHHANAITQRKAHEAEIVRLRDELQKMRSEKKLVEETMRKFERARGLFEELDRTEAELQSVKSLLPQRKADLKQLTTEAWLGVLYAPLVKEKSKAQDYIAKLRGEEHQASLASELRQFLQESLQNGSCNGCGRKLDRNSKAYVNKLIASIEKAKPRNQASAELDKAIDRLGLLKDVPLNDNRKALKAGVEALEDLQIKKHGLEDRIREILDATKGIDKKEMGGLSTAYENAVKQIQILENGIEEEQKALNQVIATIDKLQAQLDRFGGEDIARERSRRELCERLHTLFEEAVSEYRNELKRSVERDAAELFIKLTTERDYAGLSINDSYGLTIVHKDGKPIPIRSSTAEHMVALSLIGALQKNAPIKGPIVIDSSFGRLDAGHSNNLLTSLPGMAQQVLLLAFGSELNPDLARKRLGASLRREYKIKRVSARHSEIERMRD